MPSRIGWQRWLPGLQVVRRYRAPWLTHDLAAGLVLAAVLVPVGIAYAVASGLPAITGLYATIVPLLAYAVFGPSRILVLGPDSSLAAIILGVVIAQSGGDPARAIALAGAMAIVSGAICILAGLMRLGFVTELLSKPIRYGYMNGIALTVLISQLPKLFGLSIESHGPARDLWATAEAVLAGQANWTAFALGAGTLALILICKRKPRVPGILIAVVAAAVICRRAGPFGARRHLGAGAAAARASGVRHPVDRPGGCRARPARRACRRAGLLRRYQRALPRLCRADRRPGRPQSGGRRSRRRQFRRRPLPGISNQSQRLAHARGRGRGGAHAP